MNECLSDNFLILYDPPVSDILVDIGLACMQASPDLAHGDPAKGADRRDGEVRGEH